MKKMIILALVAMCSCHEQDKTPAKTKTLNLLTDFTDYDVSGMHYRVYTTGWGSTASTFVINITKDSLEVAGMRQAYQVEATDSSADMATKSYVTSNKLPSLADCERVAQLQEKLFPKKKHVSKHHVKYLDTLGLRFIYDSVGNSVYGWKFETGESYQHPQLFNFARQKWNIETVPRYSTDTIK